MSQTRLFLDTEFTGLHQQTSLISLAIVAETGRAFYAEFSDFKKDQLTPWLEENVLSHLTMTKQRDGYIDQATENLIQVKGNHAFVRSLIETFLGQFEAVGFWIDYVAFDWVLFCELWGGSMELPKHVYYIPFCFSTHLSENGIDPNIDRIQLLDSAVQGQIGPKHHAYWDVMLNKLVFQQLGTNVTMELKQILELLPIYWTIDNFFSNGIMPHFGISQQV